MSNQSKKFRVRNVGFKKVMLSWLKWSLIWTAVCLFIWTLMFMSSQGEKYFVLMIIIAIILIGAAGFWSFTFRQKKMIVDGKKIGYYFSHDTISYTDAFGRYISEGDQISWLEKGEMQYGVIIEIGKEIEAVKKGENPDERTYLIDFSKHWFWPK